MSLKPVTVLRRARTLIEDPTRWVKGLFTKKVRGRRCYCAVGALATASGVKILNGKNLEDKHNKAFVMARNFLAQAVAEKGKGGGYWWDWVPSFNDAKTTTHEKVLAAFDKAIALAKDA